MAKCSDIVIWFAMWLTATSAPGELANGALSALAHLANVWDSFYWNNDYEHVFDPDLYYHRLFEIRSVFFKYICARRALYNYVCKHGVRNCSYFNFFVSNFVQVSQQFPFEFNQQTDSYIDIVKQGLAVYRGLKHRDGNIMDEVRVEQILLRKVSRKYIRSHFSQSFKQTNRVLKIYQIYLSRSTGLYTTKEVPQYYHKEYDCVDGVLIKDIKLCNLNKVLEQMFERKMDFKLTPYIYKQMKDEYQDEYQDEYWDKWDEDNEYEGYDF